MKWDSAGIVSVLLCKNSNKFVFIIVFTFIMSLKMVAINKTMDYFICKNYLLHHNKTIIITTNLYFVA